MVERAIHIDHETWLFPEQKKRAPPSISGETDDPANSPSEPIRLLIIEDDFFIAADMEATLSQGGYEVVGTVADEEEAFKFVEETRPHLLLVDIRLGGGSDGIELARALRERHGVPCMFVTAYGDPKTQARGESAQPRGWLIKPFNSEQLLSAVDAALKTRQ